MKLEIRNKNGCIVSAYFKNTETCLFLQVNTTLKHILPSLVEKTEDSISFRGWSLDGSDEIGDTITLIAENSIDCKILNRRFFTDDVKNQVLFLFPDKKLYTNFNPIWATRV